MVGPARHALHRVRDVTYEATIAACPNCAVGRQARAEVWTDGFGFNLAVARLPFLVIGAICARLELSGRKRTDAASSAAPERSDLDELDFT